MVRSLAWFTTAVSPFQRMVVPVTVFCRFTLSVVAVSHEDCTAPRAS